MATEKRDPVSPHRTALHPKDSMKITFGGRANPATCPCSLLRTCNERLYTAGRPLHNPHRRWSGLRHPWTSPCDRPSLCRQRFQVLVHGVVTHREVLCSIEASSLKSILMEFQILVIIRVSVFMLGRKSGDLRSRYNDRLFEARRR